MVRPEQAHWLLRWVIIRQGKGKARQGKARQEQEKRPVVVVMQVKPPWKTIVSHLKLGRKRFLAAPDFRNRALFGCLHPKLEKALPNGSSKERFKQRGLSL